MQAHSPGREVPLEEGMAAHSSILAWRIPWTEEPGRQAVVHRVPKNWTQEKQLGTQVLHHPTPPLQVWRSSHSEAPPAWQSRREWGPGTWMEKGRVMRLH